MDHRVDRLDVAHPEAEAGARAAGRAPRHRLHAAGDADLEVAGADRLVGEPDRAHARGADLVDRLRGDLLRDPALDLGLARGDLALAGLQHLADRRPAATWSGVDLGALERGRDRGAAEVGGVEASESAPPILPNGVRAVPRMTVLDIWRLSSGRRRSGRSDGLTCREVLARTPSCAPRRLARPCESRSPTSRSPRSTPTCVASALVRGRRRCPAALAGAPRRRRRRRAAFKKTAAAAPRGAPARRARRRARQARGVRRRARAGRGGARAPDARPRCEATIARLGAARAATTPAAPRARWSRARCSPPTASTASRAPTTTTTTPTATRAS